jgi:predicted dehydrogenase
MNVGIVGCGEISKVHADAIMETKKCTIVSVCDLKEERAAALAKKYSVPKIYTDFSKMLQEENLDIVHVTTPPQVHEHMCIEAMDSGCNVLVEKPMCMTIKEADNMIEAAKRNAVKLGVVHSFLFTPAISNALKMVENGEIGDLLWADTVVSINSLVKWQNARGFPTWYYTLQGGLFGEIIPHGLYIQLGFLGKLDRIFGITRKSQESSKLVPFSEIQVLMECEKGLGGLFISERIASPYTVLMVRLVGTDKILLINVPASTIAEVNVGSSSSAFERAMMNVTPAFQMLGSSLSLATKVLTGSVGPHMSHKILVSKFVESIENNSDLPVTPEEGREVIKATNMLWENILS